MTKDQIEYKLSILRKQKDMPHANYRKYLVNIYNYYQQKCDENNADWCHSDLREIYKIVTVGAHNPDVSWTACKNYTKELKDMGYIKDKCVDGEWRSYVLKELDF